MKNIKNLLSFLRLGLLQQLFVGLILPIITPTSNTPISYTETMFENISLTTVEIIQNNGYSVEVHYAITNDGYILELHRIPKSKNGRNPTKNHPVFIHHGILGSSADWVLGGSNISLPMQLADEGYDVWLANCRGNTYSRNHVSMSYKQRAYWNFSLHEIGTYDLPAAIDYILINTNRQQLHYIGYSMGTCVFYIMASEKPEYQPKIRSQISLAPVAYMSNTRSTLKYIAPYSKIINFVYQRMTKGMLMPQSKLQTFLASTVCTERITQKLICEKYFIFSVCGSDPHFFNGNLIPLIMGHFPAGTSSKLATHFAQFVLKDRFCQYDYGPVKNMQLYNSTEPPKYNLKSIKVPITLIYGENDILSEVTDVMKLNSQLPNVMDAFPASSPYFNHVDFLWGINVTEEINDPIKKILHKTDDTHWKYTGPNTAASDRNRKKTTNVLHNIPPSYPMNNVNFVPSLDFVIDNLDAIISNAMPQCVDECDAAEFEQEQEMQKVIFGNLLKFIKSTEKKYGQHLDDFTNDISEWTDDVTFGVTAGLAGARDVLENQAEKTSALISDKLAMARKSAADGIAKAENSVSYGIAKAESSVSYGIAKAESSVSYGVTTAEKFIVNGVTKAEQSVVGGVAMTNNYLQYGLNKANQAVGNTLNITYKSLNKAFWFLK